jgi:hypothetical protein
MSCKNPTFDLSAVYALREKLERHPIYASIRSVEDMRVFMGHHVYSVWDFMSLLKCLQHMIAPACFPWAPSGNPTIRRFINEIVLAEESDEGLPQRDGTKTYLSHFELYCQAMEEIGADITGPLAFSALAQREGIQAALTRGIASKSAQQFMTTTFGFIGSGKPHVVAAAFALGREEIVPVMFRSLLREMQVSEPGAPAFHYYLERHIQLDGDMHGPLSLLMLEGLCAGDPLKLKEAQHTAFQAIEARLRFWDGVRESLESQLVTPAGPLVGELAAA